MNNALEWIFRVKAQVAGIRAAVAGLTRVQKSLEGVRASSARTTLPRLYLTGVGSVLAGLAAVEAGYRRLASTASWAIQKITSLPGLVTAGLAGLGAKLMLDAVAFRQNTEVALRTVLGSREAAAEALEAAMRFAARTPFTTQQVVDAYKRLAIAGFKPIEIPVILKGVGDLSAMQGFSQEAVDRIITALTQIRAKGRVQGEELMQLAEAGAPLAVIYEKIAARLKVTAEEARKLISAGRISSDLGIVAVLEAIRDTVSGGRLGGLMDQFADTLTGLWSTLKSRPFELLKDVRVEPLENLLRNLVAITDTTSGLGQRLKAGLEGIIGAGVESLFGPLAKATDPRALEPALTAWLDQLKGWVKDLGPTLRAAWAQVRDFAAGLKDAFAIMREAWGYLRPVLAFLSGLVRPLGEAEVQAAGAASGFARLAGAALGLVAAWRLLNILTLGLPGALLRLGGALLKVGAVRLLPGLRPALTQVWGTLKALFPRILAGLGRLFVGLGPWGWLVSGAITAGYLIIKNWDRIKAWFKGMWDAVAKWARSAWDGVAQAAGGAWARVTSWFSALADKARSTWQGVLATARRAWQELRDAIGGVVNSIVDSFKGLPGRIAEALRGLGARLVEAIKAEVARVPGGELLLRALTSVTDGARRVWEAGATVAGALARGAKEVLQVRSPSRLFAYYGRMAMAGLALGATAMTPAVGRAVEASIQRAVPEVVAPVVAPQVVPPEVVAPVVAPQVVPPKVVPEVAVPVIAPRVESPRVVPRVEVPVVTPQVEKTAVESPVVPAIAVQAIGALPRITPPTPTLLPAPTGGPTLSAPQVRTERNVVVNITLDGARDPKTVAREIVEALDEWAAGRIVVRGLEFLALEEGHA
jgi:tape measure domain-containing protein